MNRKDITTTLSHLQRLRIGGEPDPSWVAGARAQLLSRVAAERSAAPVSFVHVVSSFRTAFSFDAAALVARPVLAGVAALAVVMGGSVGMVSASLGSIPGDPLYQVKIASEHASIAVAGGDADKATLRIEYVGRRVDEVSKIAATEEPGKTGRLTIAVQHIRQDLGSVEQSLNDVSRKAEPTVAAEVAKLVDRKSEEYSATLNKTDAQLSVPGQVAVKEAKVLVEDISVQAVAVLVQANANGGYSSDELAAKVGQKIDSITGKANLVAVDSSTSTEALPGAETANQAITALGEAKDLLNQQDFASALNKVIEGKELVQAAEKIVDATNGTAALSAVSAATSTPSDPMIIGGDTTVGIGPTPTSTSVCGTSACLTPQATSTASQPVSGVSTSTSTTTGR